VSQTQKTEDGTPLFSMPIRMSFSSADGRTRDYQVLVNEKEQSFSFAVDFKPAMFRFDPDSWVLKKLDLTGVPKAMLVHQLANDPAVMGRVHAAHALAALGGTDAVEALQRAVSSDFHWGVGAEAASALATIGTPPAREALKAAVAVADPRVRRSVVAALGNFKDESVADLLAGILSGGQEQSYFVLADAAVALGKTGSEKAFPALQAALAVPSWNEVVRVGVLNGLAELGDARGADLAADYAGAGKPWHARPAAIAALGKLAGKAPKALDALHSLAQSEEADQFTLRMAVVGALGEAKNPASIQVLGRLGKTAVDGRIKRAVAEAIGQVESAQGKPSAQVDELKAQVEGLTGKLKELTERLDKQEAASKPAHRTARKRSTRKGAARRSR
jgi:aminopeptidase N